MPLTGGQPAALKTDIAANANTIPSGQTWTNSFAGQQVKNIPNTGDGNATIAGWYNQQASPNFFGNYATVPADDIFNAVNWKFLTPKDAIPTAPDLTVQVWMAHNAMCQTLQMNVQTLLLGRTIINATKGKIRSAFQDALSTVPSDTGGAAQDAGWVAVQKILCRKLSFVEKLFADTSTGDGSANTLAATCTFEGTISGSDVDAARA